MQHCCASRLSERLKAKYINADNNRSAKRFEEGTHVLPWHISFRTVYKLKKFSESVVHEKQLYQELNKYGTKRRSIFVHSESLCDMVGKSVKFPLFNEAKEKKKKNCISKSSSNPTNVTFVQIK